MFKIISFLVLLVVIFGSALVTDSQSAEPDKSATSEFKVNGASFAECVSMADALTDKGDKLSASENYDKAIEYYNMAISINANHATALLSRAVAYYNLGTNELALIDINKSIEIDDKVARAFYYKGIIHNEAKEYDKALESFNRSIALNPDQPLALNNRGIAFVKKGLFDNAIDDYNSALSKDSNLIQSLSNRGDAYEQLGNYRKACKDWKRACDKEFCDKFKFMQFVGACKDG